MALRAQNKIPKNESGPTINIFKLLSTPQILDNLAGKKNYPSMPFFILCPNGGPTIIIIILYKKEKLNIFSMSSKI